MPIAPQIGQDLLEDHFESSSPPNPAAIKIFLCWLSTWLAADEAECKLRDEIPSLADRSPKGMQ
jgi:hypothetical protein